MNPQLVRYIALLRGVNVGGHNRLDMPALCSLCAEIGCTQVKSYIQSGNLVFASELPAAALEAGIERGIQRQFAFAIPVLVRSASDWAAYIDSNPFDEASASAPNAVMLALSKAPPKLDAVRQLAERARDHEEVVQIGDALWVHFPLGVGRSKLTPTLLDRVVGSPVTMRNWRTVQRLGELL